ncbi:MAG: cytidine deaminase [Ignavibacteria bacterium]|nr:cytidine deaminase [Ignavibacteria bacterium]
MSNCFSIQSWLYFPALEFTITSTRNDTPVAPRRPSSKLTQYKQLVSVAQSVRRLAHAPFSNFHVGAALLATDGRIYTGCNIENSSYGLTICAERTAVFKAISEGERNFRAIAVISDESGFTPPCGACRQVLMDLAGNIDFIMANAKGEMEIVKLKELLPLAFTPKNLKNPHRS